MELLVIEDISSLYTCNGEQNGLVENGAVVFRDDQVVFAGPMSGLETALAGFETSSMQRISGKGKIVMPGLVDCHTHSVWAGSRADEFQRRLAGESYVKILEEGGGILSTVENTRLADLDTLSELAKQRVRSMRDHHGVTTVEIKSGYGLTPQDELKMLQAAKSCSTEVRVFTTFLGAHTIPRDYKTRREEYVKQVIEEQLPMCVPFADAIDIFCDRGAFTLDEARQILQAGADAGLKVKAHAEQIESTGCAKLVAELNGLSADHLEQLDENGAIELAKHDVVAVLLPGAQLYLKDVSPPVPLLRQHGVKMAIGTDLNPGSSPVHSLWTSATLACILQTTTVEEAIQGITRNAGLALGQPNLGWLGKGSVADAIILNPPPGEPPKVASLIQHMGTPRVEIVIQNGKIVTNHQN